MSDQPAATRYVLLPVYCRSIGLALVALALAATAVRYLWEDILPSTASIRTLLGDALLLGLLLISWSKDRDEDEFTVFIRLKSLAYSFTQAVLFVIIAPLLNLKLSGTQVVLYMLIIYLLTYYPQKWYR